MADDDETPPLARPAARRRLQSATERDNESDRARRERERQASTSGEILDPIPDEITGRYEGDELEMYRSKRSADDRITRLEYKHDKLTESHGKLAESVNRVAQDVSEMRGEMKVIPRLVEVLEKAAERRGESDHVILTTKVDVERARALEPVEAAKARRGWITSIIAIVATAVAAILGLLKVTGN